MKASALPFLRIMFLFSSGMLIFYMLGGALRSAGDARTPMVLGVVMTALNLILNIILIRGLGPIPAFGAAGSAMGTVIASGLVAVYAIVKLWRGGFGRHSLGEAAWVRIGASSARYSGSACPRESRIAMNVGGALI